MREWVSFCTISCGVWGFGVKKGIFWHHFLWRGGILVTNRVFFGTIFCGEWGFGVRKSIIRHHFLWRVGIRCQIEYLLAPFFVAWWGVGVKKSIFLHQKFPWMKSGAKIVCFLHRKPQQAVRRQKVSLSAPDVVVAQEVAGVGFVENCLLCSVGTFL